MSTVELLETSIAQGLVETDGAPSARRLSEAAERVGVPLPSAHIDALATYGGLRTRGSFFRIFSLGGEWIELAAWNDPACWKFAWPERVREYLCFGETAWGDQYAYRLTDLDTQRNPPVHFLDALAQKAEQIASCFEDFLVAEFLRNAREPYDDMTRQAQLKMGSLEAGENLVYVPSPLVGGSETVDSIERLPAVAAMTINGDVFSQTATSDRAVRGMESYLDSEGRTRIRLLWA